MNKQDIRLVFMGTPQFAVPSLEALHREGYNLIGVVTQPDRPRGRGQKVSCSPVKEAALGLGLPIFQPEKIRDEGFVEILKGLSPHLIIVVAFGQILPDSILSLPPFGCVNVHASLLPAYRGAAPIHWAILQGEQETGITTMLMDRGLDTGAMLLQEKITISSRMNFGQLHDHLAAMGAKVLLDTIPLWQEGKIKPIPQDDSLANYAPLLKREHEWLDWSRPAGDVHNHIRGLDPWPGASASFGRTQLKIRESRIYREKGQDGVPGTVLERIKGQGFVVQTGEGSVLITAVQPMGKKTMTGDSFVNGYHLEVGYVFSKD